MNFLFAWRYFKAKKSTNAINIIAWISVVAIILITAAFIVVLSVFNGFEGLVKSLYSSFYTDIRIGPREGKVIKVSPEQLKELGAIPAVRDYSLEVEEQALLQNGEVPPTLVYLKGVDAQYPKVAGVPEKVVRGRFDVGTPDTPGIVLGSGIENALELESDKNLYPVTAYLFRPGVNINVIDPYQALSADNLYTSGTFYIQQDIDDKYAFTNVGFMKRMLGMGKNEYSAIEIALKDPKAADEVKRQLQNIFGASYLVRTRYEQNQGLYSVMNMEKWVIYGILTLMLIVAAFTMIGALTMLVLEKQKDIQVLKALGADNRLVGRIFLSEGLLLGAIGAAIGILLAILICWAQVKYKLVAISGGTFVIDYYPVKMNPGDFLLVLVTVFSVAFLSSWFPSRKAALQPIELKS